MSVRQFLMPCLLAWLSTLAQAQSGAPAWSELGTEQRTVLAPLAQDWDRIEPARRQKWLGLAARYPDMTPEEQARMQNRLHIWARLTPEARDEARARYRRLQRMPETTREALKQKWDVYESLPEEEKRRLSEDALRKRVKRKAASASTP